MWNFPLLLSCSLYMDSELWLEMDKVPVVLPIIGEHLRMKWKWGPQSYSRLPRHTIASITRCSFHDLPLASNWKECRKECYGKSGCLPSVMQVQLIFMVEHLVLSPYGAGHPPCLLHSHSVGSNWFHEPAVATSNTMKGPWAIEITIF